MNGQSLARTLDSVAEVGLLASEIPDAVTSNIASTITLRPYQTTALERFAFYMDKYPQRPKPAHLLFHMATGSGKTVIMAALILDLYARGHRNFLFFVNSTQIIEKTKANFLAATSSKYLFADPLRFDGRPVAVREVGNFDEADADSINIHFTTIQGLHSRMVNPRENGVSVEDFAGRRVVLISDEAHHLNADTKKGEELKLEASWESTVDAVFRANPDNLLLEFTATANLGHAAIAAKYHDKILYDYSLRQFRADRYSKEIELRRADISLDQRMLQAVVLSQYRRKLAGEYGLSLKPVVMMKSRRVADSADNEAAFHVLIETLDGDRLTAMMSALPAGDTVGDALRHVTRAGGGISADDFAREIRLDFAPAKVRNVNKPEDLARQQIELNSLEDHDNEVRCIFAVDKLNEGWDVLNLFDIVRLYDQGTNSTTNQEAQLIGRGARYWPFVASDLPDEPREQRKYDADEDHPLRAIEQLHYHCTHDPAYVGDIKKALVESGLIDADTRKATVKVKDSFRQTDFFRSGLLFANSRQKNDRKAIFKLDDYQVPRLIQLSLGHSGRTSEGSAFDGDDSSRAGDRIAQRTLDFAELGPGVIRHALDADPYFHFANLRRHFPKLASRAEFVSGADFLGGVRLEVSGPKAALASLDVAARLTLARGALDAIAGQIAASSFDHIGTRDFTPHRVNESIADVTLTVGGTYRTQWKDWTRNEGIDLATLDWFAHDDFFGTSAEMELILSIAKQIDRLRADFGEIRLIRNEKAVKLYAFDDGAGFEPDFLLFLQRDLDGSAKMVQIFVEPKAPHLAAGDAWKQAFLQAIGKQAKLPDFYVSTHRVDGVPFFDPTDWKSQAAFSDAVRPFRPAP